MLESNLPSLDLHGENKEITKILVNQFITDNIKMGNNKIVIVHGIGTGTLRKEVNEFLRKDKRIEKFYINFFNPGCTIVEIRENIDK